MKTEKLTKTNLQSLTPEKIELIEKLINCEIEDVYNYNPAFKGYYLKIFPETPIMPQHYYFKNLMHKVNSVSFDPQTMKLTITGRNKWKRSNSTVNYQLCVIGYKLNTVSIAEGFIYGNAIKLN